MSGAGQRAVGAPGTDSQPFPPDERKTKIRCIITRSAFSETEVEERTGTGRCMG